MYGPSDEIAEKLVEKQTDKQKNRKESWWQTQNKNKKNKKIGPKIWDKTTLMKGIQQTWTNNSIGKNHLKNIGYSSTIQWQNQIKIKLYFNLIAKKYLAIKIEL